MGWYKNPNIFGVTVFISALIEIHQLFDSQMAVIITTLLIYFSITISSDNWKSFGPKFTCLLLFISQTRKLRVSEIKGHCDHMPSSRLKVN